MTNDDAIPAATLVVWNDRPNGPEILVVERSAKMAFAAGAIVFPGGRVDPLDRAMAESYGRPDDAHKITAIRETLEETGVGAAILGLSSERVGLELQQALHEGANFAELLSLGGLRLDLDALTAFARWMPAFKQPRKFDTLFYLVAAPAGEWIPHPQESEVVTAEWCSPAQLLERIDQGVASAIFPTKRNLERLALHATFDAALADARGHSIETIIPWVEEIDGAPHVRIPEGRGYPVVSEPLATAFRA